MSTTKKNAAGKQAHKPAAKKRAAKRPVGKAAKKVAAKAGSRAAKAAKRSAERGPAGDGKPPARDTTMRAASRKHVTVRMYNVGFGDAFLLAVPGKDRDYKVLVDCGVHSTGPNKNHTISEMARLIVRDVTEPDGTPRIDVVVCTHRHQDHVSGFRDSSIWEAVEVGEVWMPWTEDPKDPDARRIRETQSKTAKHLHAALTALQARPGLSAAKQAAAAEVKDLVENSLTNAEAMHTLHDGFAGEPRRRFLPYKTHSRNSFKPEALSGVTVHVMGPSRDMEVIRDMDPPKGKSYLRLMEAAAASSPDQGKHFPFHPNWWIPAGEYSVPALALDQDDIRRIQNVGDGQELAIAVALEKAVNGTSLMLMFQIGRAYLLFPGDAQWGTWSAALNHPDWRPLLERTTFYKIGHHGSHNATPVEFVEDVIGQNFSAMASTRKMSKWKYIPKRELMEALRKKSERVVRSDAPDPVDPKGFVRLLDDQQGTLYVETQIPI